MHLVHNQGLIKVSFDSYPTASCRNWSLTRENLLVNVLFILSAYSNSYGPRFTFFAHHTNYPAKAERASLTNCLWNFNHFSSCYQFFWKKEFQYTSIILKIDYLKTNCYKLLKANNRVIYCSDSAIHSWKMSSLDKYITWIYKRIKPWFFVKFEDKRIIRIIFSKQITLLRPTEKISDY